jgi:hypothetical protein
VGRRFFPLDEELGLLPQRYTPRLIELIVYVGMTVPFREGSFLLRLASGTEVGAETIRRLTERAGREAVRLETEETDREEPLRVKLSRPVTVADRVQQVSVDGAMVPLVRGEWGEVKLLAIGRVVPTADGVRARELSYFARLTDHASFTHAARIEFDRRQTDAAREVVAVTDGAEWIQGFLDARCPDAVRVIDWGHAAGYIGEAGQALFGPGTADCCAWVERQLQQLWQGNPQAVVSELARLEHAAAGGEAVRLAHQYLGKRVDQLRYASFRERGYPVGSGIVESGNKLVVQRRLKGSGMHWTRSNVNSVLALRCASASGRWRERWRPVCARLRRPRNDRPAQRSPLPGPAEPPAPLHPKPPPTPTVVNGRPTSAHPWKRFPSCHAKT